MKSKYLFPSWCSLVGYVMAIPGLILGYLYTINGYEIPGFGIKMREKDGLFQKSFENFTNELAVVLVVIGLILIAFSKIKREDELNAKLRLNALYWSVIVYYVLYILALFFIIIGGEIPFVNDHATEINIFTPLLIFIFRYNYLRYVNKESYLINEPRFLPNSPFKSIAIFGAIISAVIIVTSMIFKENDELIQTIYLLMVASFLLWAYTKSRIEDEMMMQLRLESLQLAVYFNYAVLLVCTFLFYSFNYLLVLLLAQFSLLLFFIVRMEYINHKNTKQLNAFKEGMGYEK